MSVHGDIGPNVYNKKERVDCNAISSHAHLDTQSDTTLILDETCDAIGVDGPAVRLSTMSAKNQMVNSKKIKGLVIRGFNCDDKLHLQVVFSR